MLSLPQRCDGGNRWLEHQHDHRKHYAFHLGILASALFMAGSLSAQSMRIDVSGVGARQVPLALAPFNGAGQAPQQLDVVIREDLQRSGMFRLVNLTETLEPMPKKTGKRSKKKITISNLVVIFLPSAGLTASMLLKVEPN